MTNKKHIALISILLSWTLNIAHSSPLIKINDDVSILFNGSSTLLWQSNLFFDDKEEEQELMLVFSPGVVANIGSRYSGFDMYIQASHEMQRLVDLSDLNDEYLHFDTVATYDGARLSLNARYSFDEKQTTAGEQQAGGIGTEVGFIKLNKTFAHIVGEYTLSPKFSFESGIRYGDRDFEDKAERLADVEYYSIPLNIFYELTPKLDLSLGYQYKLEEVRTPNAEDFQRDLHFINMGARGDLFPKLKGSFRVGYNAVRPEGHNRNSDQTLGLNADLTYLTTPKLTSQLGLRRGFDVGSEGQSTETTAATIDINYIISIYYTASLFTHLTYRDFKDGFEGQDFIHQTGFRVSYVPNQYWNFGTGYSYFENDSNRIGQDFANHMLQVSAALRY